MKILDLIHRLYRSGKYTIELRREGNTVWVRFSGLTLADATEVAKVTGGDIARNVAAISRDPSRHAIPIQVELGQTFNSEAEADAEACALATYTLTRQYGADAETEAQIWQASRRAAVESTEP